MSSLERTVLADKIIDHPACMFVKMLRNGKNPDRRLDSLVTALAFAPEGSVLDEEGLDGWDILAPSCDGMEMWMEASDVLYVTRYADAALELCQSVAGDAAPALIARALTLITSRRLGTHRDIAGIIARHIAAETLEWVASR